MQEPDDNIQGTPFHMSGRSGTLGGHITSGAPLVGLGLFWLGLTWKRARDLPLGQSFAEKYIPERNTNILGKTGMVIICATLIGIMCEVPGMIENPEYEAFSHLVLYSAFMLVGIVGILESQEQRRLPVDSHPRCLALVLCLHFIIMNDHGKMKSTPTDSMFHICLAYIGLCNAVVLAYSIWNPSSLEAYIAGYAFTVLQGTWTLAIGLYSCCVEISAHFVSTHLCWQVLVITAMVIIAVVTLKTPASSKHNNGNTNELRALQQQPLSDKDFGKDLGL